MIETSVLIVGASFSGLAMAASLSAEGVDHLLIEKEAEIAVPWRNHYERLHLHTNKGVSALPFYPWGPSAPRYPSRQQVLDYLEAYRVRMGIGPVFNTAALSVSRDGDHWITTTTNGVFRSRSLVVATGAFARPRVVNLKGMESFPGRILHSSVYKTGKDFKGQKVLVLGFGNSACEIAIDLFEQGASPVMAVRSPVNIVPRDLLGIPILRISLLLSRLPMWLADGLSGLVMRLKFGDIRRLGLQQKEYGPFEQLRREGVSPVLDIGTLGLIRKGCIGVRPGIDHIDGRVVHFVDGQELAFDAIVAAIGYDRNYADFIAMDASRVADLRVRIDKQQFFGKDGLYFCGFWVAPTGMIREIARDAQKIAADIVRK